MRPLGRNIPWKSISIPWIGRSIQWKIQSKATFQRKIGADLRHIVAKKPFSGVHAAGPPTDVFHYQTFLIFAYLQAREQAREKIRFSVLKNSGADSMKGGRGHARSALRRGGIPAAPPKPSGR